MYFYCMKKQLNKLLFISFPAIIEHNMQCFCPMFVFFVPPPVLGKIRSAVGSAQLLMSQKFQQFYWLCQQNLVSCRLCMFSNALFQHCLILYKSNIFSCKWHITVETGRSLCYKRIKLICFLIAAVRSCC